MATLLTYKLGFNQSHYTFALILQVKIVLCSMFHWTKFVKYKCLHMKFFLWRVADLEALVELLPERDRVRPPAPARLPYA